MCHVTRGVARVALQQEHFRRSMGGMYGVLLRASISRGMLKIVKQLTVSIDEPLGSFRQNGRLHQMLPWCKARRFELSTAQPERDAGSALHSATIRAECSMKKRVAELQLK